MKSIFTTSILGLAAICLMASCSSKTKTTETTAAATSPTVTTATATAPTPQPEMATKMDQKAKAAMAATAKAEGLITCTSGSETRTLEIKPTEGKACEVIYTKGGEAKSVASAITDTEYCNTVSEKVSNNLEAAGYTCQ